MTIHATQPHQLSTTSASSKPVIRRMNMRVYNRNPSTKVESIVMTAYTTTILF